MQNTPTILAIDTSTGPCSVALLHKGSIVAHETEATPGKQSARLVPMIESALKAASLSYKDLDLITCTIGPGGFTGIRVGLAAARAIAVATEKPFVGLTSLEVIAYGAKDHGDVLAVIDAYRGQYYVQRFRVNSAFVPQSDPLLVDEKMVASLGHGAKKLQETPQASDAGLLAAYKWASGAREFPSDPLYIREPDAKLPASPGLKHAGELLS